MISDIIFWLIYIKGIEFNSTHASCFTEFGTHTSVESSSVMTKLSCKSSIGQVAALHIFAICTSVGERPCRSLWHLLMQRTMGCGSCTILKRSSYYRYSRWRFQFVQVALIRSLEHHKEIIDNGKSPFHCSILTTPLSLPFTLLPGASWSPLSGGAYDNVDATITDFKKLSSKITSSCQRNTSGFLREHEC